MSSTYRLADQIGGTVKDLGKNPQFIAETGKLNTDRKRVAGWWIGSSNTHPPQTEITFFPSIRKIIKMDI